MGSAAGSGRSLLAERRARSLQACLAFAAVACVVFLRWPSAYSTLEQIAYDTATRYRPNPPPVRDIVLVAIDDESLAEPGLGRFPWPRGDLARIVDNLRGARAIGLDVLLLEPDARDPEGDRALAEVIGRAGNVVLPASILEGPQLDAARAGRLDAVRRRLAPAPLSAGPRLDPEQLETPLPDLSLAAAGIGFANLVEDGDGRYRRARPWYAGLDGLLYPNFAAEVARVASGRAPADFYAPSALEPSAGRVVPVAAGEMWIHFSGPAGTVPRISAADVWRGDAPPDAFAGKVVLIGATAAGLYDIRPAPYRGTGGRMYGAEMNASIVSSILFAPPLRALPAWVVCASVLALALAAGWMMWSVRVVAGTIAFGGLFLLLIACYACALWYCGLVGALSPALMVVVGAAAIALGDRLLAEARMRSRMVDLFSAYVAPEVARRLARNPEDLSLGGTRRDVTVMFTDVRGFTTISETADPQDLMEQMTEYFDAMVGAVFRFEGLVDKFIGDGIMALWGCFGEETESDPRKAVLAALMMRELMPRLNARWAEGGRPTLRIGVAIHAGQAIVGNMGAERKWNYTAAGDVVNTAARIEELCKPYKERWETTILVSEDVVARIGDLASLERIGEAAIRGRSHSIGVYAVLGARRSGGGEGVAPQAEDGRDEAADRHATDP